MLNLWSRVSSIFNIQIVRVKSQEEGKEEKDSMNLLQYTLLLVYSVIWEPDMVSFHSSYADEFISIETELYPTILSIKSSTYNIQ